MLVIQKVIRRIPPDELSKWGRVERRGVVYCLWKVEELSRVVKELDTSKG